MEILFFFCSGGTGCDVARIVDRGGVRGAAVMMSKK